jgi:glycine/D-amino acid oxidase-like deaminating enzyme
MRVRSSETYWLLKNGLIQSYPSLRQHINCDVLIIGGGITGTIMAWQLSSEGYNTVLIDRGDVCLGSTSATTALLQYEIDVPLYAMMNSLGEEVAKDCYAGGVKAIDKIESVIASRGIECGFERKSSLYIAHNRKQEDNLLKELYCREQTGIDVEWITETELNASYGINGMGAIRSTAAASVDAYSMSHSLLEDASRHFSLRVYDHTTIEAIAYQAKENHVLIKGGWKIQTGKIIFATGYETFEYLKDSVADLISTYACISEPMEIPVCLRENILWTTHDPYFYLRSTPDNRLLYGGGDVRFKNAAGRDRLIDKKEIELLNQLKKLIPGIDVIPDFAWAGTFGVTKDALPYIGCHPEYPNSYFVLGLGGNGITFSIMAMDIISDALAGRPNKFLSYFRFGR